MQSLCQPACRQLMSNDRKVDTLSFRRTKPVFGAPVQRSGPNVAHARPQIRAAASQGNDSLPRFPDDHPEAIQQAITATQQALADGVKLLEIEFPSAGVNAVAGDAEGANEMTYSSQHLRKYCRMFQQQAKSTRIFFPDQGELRVAKYGKSKDPNAGSWDIEAVWNETQFQLSALTRPSGLSDLGLDFSGFDPSALVKPSDELVIAAYPSFDPREMAAADVVYKKAAKPRDIPMIFFNAELDRLRNGYYPALFYPKMAKLSKELVPLIEPVYYIHNFKGAGGGALLKVYGQPWQVLLRLQEGMKVVHTQEERLSLKEVSLEILPTAVRKLRQQAAA